jgi:hypothetical protein
VSEVVLKEKREKVSEKVNGSEAARRLKEELG